MTPPPPDPYAGMTDAQIYAEWDKQFGPDSAVMAPQVLFDLCAGDPDLLAATGLRSAKPYPPLDRWGRP